MYLYLLWEYMGCYMLYNVQVHEKESMSISWEYRKMKVLVQESKNSLHGGISVCVNLFQ